jgi:hypothetical protein
MTMRYLAVCAALLLLGTACAQKVAFNPSSTVPAADVKAKVARDSNNNAQIELNVEHLADPKRLDPPKDVYVVWAETPGGRTSNLGRLMVDKDRRGTLKTTTSLEEFRLLVSAEYLSAANASSPGTFPILVTDFFRVK